jgi:hypothetical protein
MLLVEGPTVSIPLLNPRVGVTLVVAAPVASIPVAALYCGGGILILKLFGARLVAPAAATFVVTAILAGITCRLYVGPLGFSVAAPVALSVVAGVVGMVTLFVEGPTVRTPLFKVTSGVILFTTVPVVSAPVAGLN